jgi:hypothetical protein
MAEMMRQHGLAAPLRRYHAPMLMEAANIQRTDRITQEKETDIGHHT